MGHLGVVPRAVLLLVVPVRHAAPADELAVPVELVEERLRGVELVGLLVLEGPVRRRRQLRFVEEPQGRQVEDEVQGLERLQRVADEGAPRRQRAAVLVVGHGARARGRAPRSLFSVPCGRRAAGDRALALGVCHGSRAARGWALSLMYHVRAQSVSCQMLKSRFDGSEPSRTQGTTGTDS